MTTAAVHATRSFMRDPRTTQVSAVIPMSIGAYQIIDRIAIGGMAEVFKARKSGVHGFEKLVAIKRLLPHLAADPMQVEMFLDEARITASLEHPHIVQAFELGTDGALHFAMEYVDGIDALAVLQECARTQIRLPAQLAALIARDVLDALDYAHEARDAAGKRLAIVHRDVSPSNVLVSWNGHVKLTDFGVALATSRRHQTGEHTLRGKYGYMSPEQVSGHRVDHRSDVFSVGILLAEMVMARRLFHGTTDLDVLLAVRDVRLDRLDQNAKDFPIDLLGVVMRALQARPDDRWQSAAAMRDAIDAWLETDARAARVTTRELAAFVNQIVKAPTAVIGKLANGSGVLNAIRVAKGTTESLPVVAAAIPVKAKTPTPVSVPTVVADPHQANTVLGGALDADSVAIQIVHEIPLADVLGEDDDEIELHTADVYEALAQAEPAAKAAGLSPVEVADLRKLREQHEAALATIDLPGDDIDPLDGETVVDPKVTVEMAPLVKQPLVKATLLATPVPEVLDMARSGSHRIPTPPRVPIVVASEVAPRRKKQHTMETAIASLVEESGLHDLHRLAPQDFAKGTRQSARVDDTPPPLDVRLPVPARRPTTQAPIVTARTGKLGRMSSAGRTGAFANYSDAVDVVEAPLPIQPILAYPLSPARAQPVPDFVPPTAERVPSIAPSFVDRVMSPYGILAMLTILMVGVFLLAMYGVI